jgi:hypothetical protein
VTDTSDLATHAAPADGAALDVADDTAAADHELVALVCRLVGDVDSHAARLSRVEERTDSLAGFVDRFEETFTGLGTDTDTGGSALSPGPTADPADTASPAAAPGDDEQPTGLNMRLLVACGDNVAALLERKIPQTGGAPYWCRRWWLHPEAIARFEATRRCWVEAVAGEGAAMVVYFEHLDAMLAALCGENGPFCGCVGGQHNDTGISAALGQDDPDKGYYRSFEHPDDTP